MKIAVFPGSFDPITTGHLDLVLRAVPLFDKIVVAVGINPNKRYLYPLETRIQWLNKVFEDQPTVEVDSYEKLTAKYCNRIGAEFILRGLRNAADFDFEKPISQMNFIIGKKVETVFMIAKPENSHISSSLVREIIKGGGNASPFIPQQIRKAVKAFKIS